MSGGNFQKFVCWDPSRAPGVIPVDAGSLSRSTLLAVHRRFEVADVPGAEGLFSDEDLLTTFRDPGKTLTIISLIGDAGAGKSHLVQWLRARLITEPNALIVYLPRNLTGLRGLLERLIDGLQDAGAAVEAAELRDQLDRAFAQTEGELPEKLLDSMARLLSAMKVDPAKDRRSEQRRVGIASALANLLRDPVSRPWFLAEQRAISRFAKQQSTFDPKVESEVGFEVSDLPSQTSLGELLGELSGPAQRALKDIHTPGRDGETGVGEAVKLLNEALTRAIPEVIGLTGEQSLDSVLDSARRTLFQRGQELFLFIEDLARLQGVDLELLNAIITPVEEDGRQVRCTIRVAIAVTSGYYGNLPETVRERGKSFDLTARADLAKAAQYDLEKFVAKYLRVLRTTSDEIEQSLAAASNEAISSGSWVPNRCSNCEHRADCHESFGDVDGVGLYPLNKAALRSMSHSAFSEDAGNGSFNPRRLLQRVLLRVTDETSTSELRGDRFPSKRLQELFSERDPLSGAVELAVGRLPQGDRRKAVTQFWGGGVLGEAERSGVAEAFGLSPLIDPPPPPPPPTPTPGGPVAPPPERQPTGVERWNIGGPLPTADAEEIREVLFNGTKQLIPWGVLGLAPDHPYMVGSRRVGQSNVLRPFSFYIEGQMGDASEPDTSASVGRTISRKDGELLLSLDQARQDESAFKAGLDVYCRLQDFLEDVAEETTNGISELLWSVDAERPPHSLLGRLAARSIAQGLGSDDDLHELAVAVVDVRPTTDEPGLSAEWAQMTLRLAEHRQQLARELLDLNSYRQGTGTPSLVRTGRLATHIATFLASWNFPNSKNADYGEPRLRELLTPIKRRDLEEASAREREAIRTLVDRGTRLIGSEGWSPSQVAAAVDDALSAATRAGVNYGDVARGNDFVRLIREMEIPSHLEVPEADGTLHEQLSSCAKVLRSGHLGSLHILTRVEEYLNAALERVNANILPNEATGVSGQRTCWDAVQRERENLEKLV